jgi:hypothetical protein
VAARANRGVFYDQKTGKARTLAGVYEFFAQKFENSTKGAPDHASPTMIAAIDTEEQRMAGATNTVLADNKTNSLLKSDSYDTDLLWAQEIFRNNQAQQLRVLAQNDADKESGAAASSAEAVADADYNAQRLVRGNQRFAHLNARQGAQATGQGMALHNNSQNVAYALPGRTAVNNPVQVMQLAQADLHTLRGRYN